MQFSKMKSLLLIACMGVFSASSYGQAVYGSLYGTVTDNGGAAIPNATVTVTDSAKGTSTEVQTNGSGEYRAEHLIPDKYDIKVTSAGFSNSETKGIEVFADSSLKVDAQLQVGGSTQTVEVTADSVPLLKTDRADVSTTFETKTMEDLPVGDRNFTNLQLLLPGAQQLGWSHAADENPQGSKQIQVDGQAFGGVAFELDGTDNQDPILGIIVINPPLDALSETKITTQNFDAEFGKAVSSVVTAQTKSGSNKFHGSLFDYRQSNATQARDPFSQSPTPSQPDKDKIVPAGLRNQFGGSIGGPIIKEKFFFFADYQGLRQKVGTAATMTLPTAHLIASCLGKETSPVPGAAAGCDFDEYRAAIQAKSATPNVYQPLIFDSATGKEYPNSVIPTAELSPQALALFTLLQPYQPNKQGNYGIVGPSNYSASGTGLFNNNQWDARGDYQVSQKIHAFARFSRFTSILTGKTIYGAAGGAGFGINNYGGTSNGADDSLATGADIAVTNTLVTDFRLGYYRYNAIASKNSQISDATALGIPGLNLGGVTGGAPAFDVADVGYAAYGSNNPNNPDAGGAQFGDGLHVTRCNCPLIQKEDQFQIVNNWTRIFGNHAFKVGADLRYARNLRVPSDSNRTGVLRFGDGPTSNNGVGGLGFATLALGEVTTFNRYVSSSTNAKEFQKRDFFYFQDTWRATSKLTVNYGLRYEFYFPERVNGTSNGALMDLKTGYLHVAGVGGVPLNMGWNKAAFPLNPRIGLAYQLNSKTVIRSGYGRSFDIGVFGSMFGHVVTQNLPVLANQAINTGTQTGYAFCLGANNAGCKQPAGQPAGGGPAALTPIAVPSNGLLPNPGYAVSTKARPNSLRLPTVDAWNLSIQRSITPTLSVTMAYVANKGTHTLSAGDNNNTNPNEAAISLPAQYSITGQPLHYDPSVAATDVSGVPAGNPATGISANGGTNNTTYLRRYYGGKLAACSDAAYTPQAGVPAGSCGWGQDISYYGDDQDSHFNALQVTLAKQFSHGLSFTSNYAWQRGIDFNSGFSTWNRQAVKGRNNDIREQQIVVYGLYQLPFGRNQMFAAHASGFVNQIIGGWQLSPVLDWASGLPFTLGLGSCNNSTPGDAPCYPNGNGSNLKTKLDSLDPVGHRRAYFNQGVTGLPGGFSRPGLDQIGTAGRNNAHGPNFFNTDASLIKNFPIRESISLQMRADAANVFNHINGANPGGNIDQGTQYVTGQAPGAAARQLQFSARVQF